MALNDLKLTFRDEFNSLSLDTGSAATDANFWNTSMYDGWVRSLDGNGELQWYMDPDYKGASSTPLGVNPFEVNNGILSIKARPASTPVHNAIWGYNYTSGVLTSAHEFSQTYGYFEVRAQVPEGKGLWPAFWLLSDDGTWPPELDIMEVIGSQTNYVHQGTHSGAATNDGKATWNSEKLSAGFHTYGMDWTASTITFYLDGQATFAMATPSDLHGPMYMLLNLAVGGNWPGSPDGTTNWATANYNVDYVRVYQHTGIAGYGGVLSAGDGAGAMGPTVNPATTSGLITASNGADVSGLTSARFIAADTGANTSRTYTAAEMGLSGVPTNTTMTVAYDAQKNITVTNNGTWGDIRNAALTSSTISGITLNNFVAVQLALSGNQNSTVNVTNARSGSITTGAGNDVIDISANANGSGDNLMTIAAGNGANRITFNGAANTRVAVSAGTGADQITIGGGTSASIQAGGGNDTIKGGSGNDWLDGGAGDDYFLSTLNDGNDIYLGGDNWDVLDFTGVTGSVTINQLSSVTSGAAGNDVFLDIFEQVVGSNFDDIISGGHGINCLDGAGGNDMIFGNGGDDLIRGGDGDDQLYCNMLNDGDDRFVGGNGFDTLNYSLLAGAVQVNQLTGTTSGAAGNDTLFDSIEQVIGSNFADFLSGDHQANTIDGGGGNDAIFGNGGDDVLRGGDGDDVFHCNMLNDGNDRFAGGNGWDTITYANLGGAVQVNQSTGMTSGAAGNDTLDDSFEQIIGTSFNDTLIGDNNGNTLQGNGGNDTINGGGGNDWLNGGAGDDYFLSTLNDGNDTYLGGDNWDVLDFTGVTGSVTINQLSSVTSGAAGNDVFLDVFEQVVGSNFDDIISGGHGINCLDGAGGNDMIFGNGGDDLIRGGDGDDQLYCNMLNDGDDRFVGGNGFDTLNYSLLAGAVQVNQLTGTTSGAAGNDTLFDSIEQVIGSNYSDSLIGDNNANTLRGGGGDDFISGGDGNDWISGDAGNNTLTGGAGNDVFAFIAGAHATVTDFNVAEDSIQLNGVSASSLTVRVSGPSTLVDLNGSTVMTLTGITVSPNAIHFT